MQLRWTFFNGKNEIWYLMMISFSLNLTFPCMQITHHQAIKMQLQHAVANVSVYVRFNWRILFLKFKTSELKLQKCLWSFFSWRNCMEKNSINRINSIKIYKNREKAREAKKTREKWSHDGNDASEKRIARWNCVQPK